jgi:histidinol phosphatase-like PHP family hydrolase
MRTGFLTFADALSVVAEHPEWTEGFRGDLQMHTDHSDGRNTVSEMAAAGVGYGYEYIAITDHSKGLKIAGGMSEEELAEQMTEIDGVNSEIASTSSGFRILRSLEMNIDPRGEGDMDPASLKGLDLVLGSFHSSLRKTEDQTDRYLAALRNPEFNILGHPRCRMFDRRLGLQADWDRLFEAAEANEKALEINAHPNRQDLNVEVLKRAVDAGNRFSIGTDAHSPGELEYRWIGVAAAILAGIPRERIVNYMTAEELLAWAKGR